MLSARAIPILLAICMTVLSEPGVAAQQPWDPIPRDDGWWSKRYEILNERISRGKPDLVFLGDSITHFWDPETWASYYEKRNALNLGIRGDRTENLLWRLDHGNIDGISPKLAIVLIGTNNLRYNTPADIAKGIESVVKRLHHRLTDTNILLLAIFPRDQDPGELRIKAELVNALVSRLDDGERIHYLDIGDVFLGKQSRISEAVMLDYLHLTRNGYRRWAKAMEPIVTELMGETR